MVRWNSGSAERNPPEGPASVDQVSSDLCFVPGSGSAPMRAVSDVLRLSDFPAIFPTGFLKQETALPNAHPSVGAADASTSKGKQKADAPSESVHDTFSPQTVEELRRNLTTIQSILHAAYSTAQAAKTCSKEALDQALFRTEQLQACFKLSSEFTVSIRHRGTPTGGLNLSLRLPSRNMLDSHSIPRLLTLVAAFLAQCNLLAMAPLSSQH